MQQSKKVWYDLAPQAAELWVVEGPPGWKIEDIDTDDLPEGFRWVDGEEWEARQVLPSDREGHIAGWEHDDQLLCADCIPEDAEEDDYPPVTMAEAGHGAQCDGCGDVIA